jgi:S1-C subfamily serine protease
MNVNQQAAPVTTGPRSFQRHRRTALAAAAGLAVVVTIAGPAGAADSGVASLLSTATTPSYLKTNSSTVASSVSGALVDIVSTEKYQGATAAGTGMVLTSTGEILTNNHVIDGATSIKVTVVATGKTYSANVVGTDPTADVAVIQLVGASGLKTIPIGDSSSVAVGQSVVAQGNAGGKGGTPSRVTGTVTALDQSITASDGGSDAEQLSGMIETNAPIVAGDSGGSLSTASGKVIGMNTAASTSNSASNVSDSTGDSSANEAYAIPIRTALTIAHTIEQGKASSTIHIGRQGFLGIQIAATSSSSSSGTGNGYGYGRGGYGGNGGGFGGGGFAGGYPGSDNGYGSDGSSDGSTGTTTATGVTVGGVITGGAAEAAGLSAGDVITSVDGTVVSTSTALNTLMATTKPGQKVSIAWTDTSGQSHTATATLGEAAAD